MVETVSVDSKDELVSCIEHLEAGKLESYGAEDVWDIWTERIQNGSVDHFIVIPVWLSQDELDRRRPYFFGSVEHDDPDKGAVLFDDLVVVDPSVVEGGHWERVAMDDVIHEFDISSQSDYIDEAGMWWIPRSQMTVFER